MVNPNYYGKKDAEDNPLADEVRIIMDNGHLCIVRYVMGRDEKKLIDVLKDTNRRFGNETAGISLWDRLTNLYTRLISSGK